ncbi:MAG: hypothetical protein M1816_005908 [Peltula sp. TS41687]|nr:MAG: hypothetical protein M1816_005908 [Peltula sp. TS41687]
MAPSRFRANTRLGTMMEYDGDGCYLADPDTHTLAGADYDTRPKREIAPTLLIQAVLAASDTARETRLNNGVTVYGSPEDAGQLTNDKGQARIPPNDWMSIPLVDDWRTKYKAGTAKVYPVGPKDQAVIDMEFDRLHEQGRMFFHFVNDGSSHPSSFSAFVWVHRHSGRN